jgi:hypothetical protein
MPFDKPRLFSPRSQDCDGLSPAPLGSDRAVGFDMHQDAATRDRATDEELGLSAELQVLASHLRGEADSLAERFAPATSPQSDSVQDHPIRRRWMWQSMAVGVAGLAILTWQIDRWQQSPPQSPTESIAQTETHGVVVEPLLQSGRSTPAASISFTPASVAASDPAAMRHSQGIAEVGIDAPAVERHPPADQVEMLRIQVTGFEKVIRKLQAELIARDAAQIESQKQIQSLQEEVAALHKQLDDNRHPSP